MNGDPENVPAYQTVRITGPANEVAELADVDAWQAREAYPDFVYGGGGAFGVACEREEGGWELHPYFGADWPQHARESMGSHFRRLAQEAEQAGDAAAHQECTLAYRRLDRFVVDELTVCGTRYRVVRAQPFIRTGPDGPEPPRPTDLDPEAPADGVREADPADGFILDPGVPTGMSEAIMKMELLQAGRPPGSAPPDVLLDELDAAQRNPGGVMLPTAYTIGELVDGHWTPARVGTLPTPQSARDTLSLHLRVSDPWQLNLSDDERAVYSAGADLLDAQRCNEITIAGRTFRIVRVERLVRIGPDGPEGPRPSDPDPQGPVLAGLAVDQDPPEEEEEAPDPAACEETAGEQSESLRRFMRLFHEEEARRSAIREQAIREQAIRERRRTDQP